MDKMLSLTPHPVVMERGGLVNARDLLPNDATNLYLITDSGVATQYDKLISSLSDEPPIVVPAGEAAKELDIACSVWSSLQERGIDRNTILIGIGGGSVCDLVGFVASCILRGVRFVLIPTTLLAMVDAAIGGKSGLNFGSSKNFIGSFTLPIYTLIDPSFLDTLPQEQIAAGMAEIIKIAVICDRSLFEELPAGPIDSVIAQAAKLKTELCSEDLRDQGKRMLLNYGHTFGHAIETATKYSIPHGRAVAIGMSCAAHLSSLLGIAEDLSPQFNALDSYDLPTCLPHAVPTSELIYLMQRDKKARAGQLCFVLATKIGHGRVMRDVPEGSVRAALKAVGAA